MKKPIPQLIVLNAADLWQEMMSKNDESTRVFAAPEGYKRLTINLPEALHTKLKIASAKRGTTATQIIESLLIGDLK